MEVDVEYHKLFSAGQDDATATKFWIGKRMGSHTIELDNKNGILVEWYNFGEDVAYEYVSQMTIERAYQPKLAVALGLPADSHPQPLLRALAERFSFKFEIEEFAKANGIGYETSTDFSP